MDFWNFTFCSKVMVPETLSPRRTQTALDAIILNWLNLWNATSKGSIGNESDELLMGRPVSQNTTEYF